MARSYERTRRLFVAVPPPSDVIQFLLRAQDAIRQGPGVRLLGYEQLHISLAFLGEVDEGMLDVARRQVRAVPGEAGGQAVIGGFIFLPDPRRARVVAVGVRDDADVLQRLHDRVVGGLVESGLMKPERRRFRPHVSIARLRTPGPVRPTHDCGESRFGVESIRLYESQLTREGARYQVLDEVKFRGSDE